jgi:hypothetical protein
VKGQLVAYTRVEEHAERLFGLELAIATDGAVRQKS